MWIIVILVLLAFSFYLVFKNIKNNKKVDSKVNLSVLEIDPNYKFKCDFHDKQNIFRMSYFVSNDCKNVYFVSSSGNAKNVSVQKICSDNIIDVQISCDKEKTGGVGRAVAGGFIAGDAGAIVGATTAKNKIQNLDIMIITKDVATPLLVFELIKTPADTSSEQYKQALGFSRKVSASIKALMEMETESKKTEIKGEECKIKIGKNSQYQVLPNHVDCPNCGCSVNATPCPNCGHKL